MRLDHVAIWVSDLERMKQFYESWFEAGAGLKYVNERKGLASYFLSFDSGARLEIMQKPAVTLGPGGSESEGLGFAHLAISVGSEAAVDALATRFEAAGHRVLDGPAGPETDVTRPSSVIPKATALRSPPNESRPGAGQWDSNTMKGTAV